MSDDLAKEIAKGALRIDWRDTESAARRVAEHAADRIEELEANLAKAADVIEWALICGDEHQVRDWVHDAINVLSELSSVSCANTTGGPKNGNE